MSLTEPSLTWSQFVQLVRDRLPQDAERQGTETLLDRTILSAAIDLQRSIPRLQLPKEILYTESDVAHEGYASRGVMPPDGYPDDTYIIVNRPDLTPERNDRHPVQMYDWRHRMDLVNGQVALNDGHGRWSIDAQGYHFLIYPRIETNKILSLNYKRVRRSFADDDVVFFREDEAEAIALYVLAHYAKVLDDDVSKSDSLMRDYRQKKNLIYIDALEATNPREQ